MDNASHAETKTQLSKSDATGGNFPEGTPKEWSMPINRVDNAAYHHDLCYSNHDDTKTSNEVCDKTMLEELIEL